eukprot:COSAG02_NODE_12223_length_1578_cov_0.945909_2_plen_27_part_01
MDGGHAGDGLELTELGSMTQPHQAPPP